MWSWWYIFLIFPIATRAGTEFTERNHTSRVLNFNKKCIKWGNTFDVSLSSANVERSCSLPDGRKICCIATENTMSEDIFAKPVGSNFSPSRGGFRSTSTGCTMEKKYFPSNQEIRDYEKSLEISRISSDHTDPNRVKALVEYAISDATIKNSSVWLDRVKYHMTHTDFSSEVNPMDIEFLSRFEVTKQCENEEAEKWIEWIEPLTITARHPYAFGRCRLAIPHFRKDTPRTDRSNVDYVLLQSGAALYRQYQAQAGGRMNRKKFRGPPKHYMFDAGTSTFDSSLFWFTCGYSQRKIGFDQIFGWEMTLLEPNDYWNRVPPKWKPFWHFYNIPISADAASPDSPRRFIEQFATPQDFVAFKLDIDNPEMEMPLALSLLSDNRFASLVDEFFFELHFRCEVMTSCGWGKRVPKESHGLTLDRPDILKFFQDLRRRGIRAHIWP